MVFVLLFFFLFCQLGNEVRLEEKGGVSESGGSGNPQEAAHVGVR
jgi:hypothetical protein